MNVLWTNLSIVFFCSFFARYYSQPVSIQPIIVRPNWLLAAMSASSIILVAGLRSNIGDTSAYMQSYKNVDFTWEIIKNQKGIGFNIFQMILQKFSHDPQFMILIISLITNLLIVLVLYKYARFFELGLFIYLTDGLFITGMNGVRQFLAAAIVFSATKYLFNGDWKKYFVIVLIAGQIHSSAYILLPIYFLVRTKAWSRTTVLLLTGAIVLVLAFNQLSTFLFSALEDTSLGGYENVSNGANILNAVIYACPILVAYVGREKLREICPNSDPIVNMAILGLIFMIIATQNWIFARITYYFGIYYILLISWIVKLFASKFQPLIYYLIVLLYFILFYFDTVKITELNYRSNYLTW